LPKVLSRLTLIVCALVFLSGRLVPASAQTPATQPPPTPEGALKVFLSCAACDLATLPSDLPFVEFVADAATADVEVLVTTAPADANQRWTLAITGRGRFTGQKRTVSFVVTPEMTPAVTSRELSRTLKLGLAEFVLATPAGRFVDVTFARPAAAAQAVKPEEKDPWNYWVFRLGASTDASGEESQSFSSYFVDASANRVTEQWKIRIGGYRSVNRSRFDVDETETIRSRLSDWSLNSLVVKSLGPKWSFGLTSEVVGSTFSNSALVARVEPGIEYDFFPYAESSKRTLTVLYQAGPARYHYEEETIFGKLSETIATHKVTVSLGLRQPWGQAGGSMTWSQHLTAPERTRLSANGSFSVRLLRSLNLNASGSYARIRDLFTLEKGLATDDEVLLRQRQLATGFRYSYSFGFSYSFGALSNATVNPRFGGG
jgi:hypothetical protein